jgi:hypothetical protein
MYDGEEISEAENKGREVGNTTRIKHDYRDEIWNQEQFTYDLKLQDFVGVSESRS